MRREDARDAVVPLCALPNPPKVPKSKYAYRQIVHFDGGNCKSSCVIYIARCKCCGKCYVGKTILELRNRISGHRRQVKLLEGLEAVTDENCLAAHLATEHSIRSTKGFNDNIRFSVLENVSSPSNLLKREQYFINEIHTFQPFGLNIAGPIGLKAVLIND